MRTKWLFGRKIDIGLLLVPVWFCWLIAFLLPESILGSEIPLWVWVSVVVGIDVSHVWSSIHRTYLDREEFTNHKKLLVLAPILSFALSFGIAFISIDLFWRCLAYVAVYHFVKQQYGFMRIYKAKAGDFRKKLIGDNFIIYLSMLYPIVFWHISPNREFVWFVQGDFITFIQSDQLSSWLHVTSWLYIIVLLYWLLEELIQGKRNELNIQWPKILWVLTTAGNWYLGIVFFNSDLVFTITNVVAHGVPYMVLVIFYQTKKNRLRRRKNTSFVKMTGLVIGSVLVLAIIEEYFWDMMVYRDNVDFFSSLLPYLSQPPSFTIQLLFIGVLAVPQITHYILDGFIWKNNDKNPFLKKTILE